MSDSKKSLLFKSLRSALPPKKIDYADFLLQFKLLCCDTLQFNLSSENHGLLKNKLKYICFSILNSYNFDKVTINLLESESKALIQLIQHKDLAIQKAEKVTLLSLDCDKYLKGIKSLLSNNTRFYHLILIKASG